jgi:hypothetical protein
MTRSATPTFDWKSNCFICGEYCNPKTRSKWSLVETAISSNSPVYSTVMAAAEQCQDLIMLNRLHSVPNGDLVAVEARYHRKKNCLPKYVQTASSATEQSTTIDRDAYTKAAFSLVAEIKKLVIDEKKVFQLNQLRTRFCELASVTTCHSQLFHGIPRRHYKIAKYKCISTPPFRQQGFQATV